MSFQLKKHQVIGVVSRCAGCVGGGLNVFWGLLFHTEDRGRAMGCTVCGYLVEWRSR
jgi:hypothetical protein